MKKVKFIGNGKMQKYVGNFSCIVDQIVTISDEDYSTQMQKHPDWWQDQNKKPKLPPSVKEKESEQPENKSQIVFETKKTWEELREIAKENGIKTFGRKRKEVEEELKEKKLI
jgi:hypothetical protein